MVLARTVFSDDGRNVITERSVLTEQRIALLRSWGIPSVYILDMDGPGQDYRQFTYVYMTTISALHDAFGKARLLNTLTLDDMDDLAEKAEDVIASETGVFGYLTMIHNTDDYIFSHSADVGIIAGLIGKWVGCSGAELKNLILAGFLHDIGKTQIPLSILNKPGKLTLNEWEMMKQHPTLGYALLKSPIPPAESVLSGVHQHHERIDGSGYPQGLTTDKISFAAKIISIADVFGAMISNRTYRPAETPFRALGEIQRQMFGKLDPELCNVFIAKALESFVGLDVWLSNGAAAKVIAMEKSALDKPIVLTEEGNCLSLVQSDLTITRVNFDADHSS